MNNITQQMAAFCTEERLQQLERLKSLYEQLLTQFPLEQLHTLPLHRYALGYQEGSFSWWLEYKTSEFGSIKGGSASKHVIYYKKKEQKWAYPEDQFSSVEEAWNALRKDILEVIEHASQDDYVKITPDNLLYSKSMLKGKISYVYAPHKMLPIFQVNHLKHFLSLFDITETVKDETDCVMLGRLLHEAIYQQPDMHKYDELLVAIFLYTNFSPSEKVYKIAPGEGANLWLRCEENHEIAIGWDDLGALTQYADFKELREAIVRAGYYNNASIITKKANEIWTFYQLKPGDVVVANKGASKIIAVGRVNEVGYQYKKEYNEKRHTIGVDWEEVWQDGFTIPSQNRWKTMTVEAFAKSSLEKWLNKENSTITPTIESNEDDANDIPFFLEIERALLRKGQAILYGPPGTGKTYTIQQFLNWYRLKKDVSYEICTFHPSFQYEDFIEGFKPVAGINNTISFKLEDGIFKTFVEKAKLSPEKQFIFVIDELNRGNVPKIFGELITLIEKDKRGLAITLPQSKLPFLIPKNLWLICTMNTSDHSIKAMDAAIKRRFAFIECMPNYPLLNEAIENLAVTPKQILEHINHQLIHLQGRDLQIGHAYFMVDGKVVNTLEDLMDIFRYEIIPLLQEYCFDNYEMLASLIGDSFVDIENNAFVKDVYETSDAFISAIESHFQVNYEK